MKAYFTGLLIAVFTLIIAIQIQLLKVIEHKSERRQLAFAKSTFGLIAILGLPIVLNLGPSNLNYL